MRHPNTNNLKFSDLRNKVLALSEVYEDEEVASICAITVAEVQQITATVVRAKWWLRNNRTGQSWPARSQRGAYRLVCAFGLVDWDWGIGAVGENAQP